LSFKPVCRLALTYWASTSSCRAGTNRLVSLFSRPPMPGRKHKKIYTWKDAALLENLLLPR
ncbi:unnamed protein product, partial [Musa acuminata subsp. burmannicoides]